MVLALLWQLPARAGAVVCVCNTSCVRVSVTRAVNGVGKWQQVVHSQGLYAREHC